MKVLAYLLIYWSRYLDEETVKGSSWSSSQAATCYYQSSDAKVEAIVLIALFKNATSELTSLFSALSL